MHEFIKTDPIPFTEQLSHVNRMQIENVPQFLECETLMKMLFNIVVDFLHNSLGLFGLFAQQEIDALFAAG
ncbi:hypothetical protein D3C77_628870 [compost metagenome]